MMSRTLLSGFLTGLLTLALLPYGQTAQAAPVTLTQADGTAFTLPAPAQRIITLAPHLAELVYEVGAGERLLATVEYSDYPAEAAALPRIGDAFRFDLERMVTLKPDLILAWDSGSPEAALSAMEDLGMTVWRTRIDSFDAMAELLEALGQATQQDGKSAADRVRQRRDALQARYGGKGELSYFYQVAQQPLYTVTGQHLISQGLAICGGRNVFADLPTVAPQIAPEAVLQADPDLLIAGVMDASDDPLAQWRAWPRLRAVQHEAFITLPADLINRATPRMLDAVALACEAFESQREVRP